MHYWTREIAHRGGVGQDLFAAEPENLFQEMGREKISRWVDSFYDRFLADPTLAPMFSRDLSEERRVQKAFFEEWMGGDSLYTEMGSGGCLAEIHQHIWITPQAAECWLSHVRESLRDNVEEELAGRVMSSLRPLARQLVNENVPAPSSGSLRCERYKPVKRAVELARKGDVEGLREAPACSEALVMAADRGKGEVVKSLLERGVPVNRAARLAPHGSHLRTPLCAAIEKRRKRVIPLLLEAGGVLDIFSASYLGDEECLSWILGQEPDMVDVLDPAEDFRKLRPLHYAVERGQHRCLDRLRRYGARVRPGSARLLAAALEHAPYLVRELLEEGASLASVGPGDWLCDEQLRGLLLSQGLRFRSAWIPALCSGNHGRKDRPEWVLGAMELGLRGDSIHKGRTALEYATRAGFRASVRLLS